MDSVVLVADSKSKGFEFARGIYEYVRKKEGRGFVVSLGDIERTDFKDGEFKLKISQNIREKKCFFIHDSNKNASVWFTELVFGLDAMRFSSPSEIIVVLPYTKFARQDMKDESRVSVNAKAVADMISLYADRGMTIDLHAPQIQEYYGIPFDNLYSFTVLIDYLKINHWDLLNDFVVVSPDAGGAKRAELFQRSLSKGHIASDLAICYKRRIRTNEIEEMKVMGDVNGKNCLVLDDMIDTGETLVKTCTALKLAGAKKVFAYGTHGIFSDGVEKFGDLDRVLVSDTLCCNRGSNFSTISLVDLFGEAIYRTIVGESLSSLFE